MARAPCRHSSAAGPSQTGIYGLVDLWICDLWAGSVPVSVPPGRVHPWGLSHFPLSLLQQECRMDFIHFWDANSRFWGFLGSFATIPVLPKGIQFAVVRGCVTRRLRGGDTSKKPPLAPGRGFPSRQVGWELCPPAGSGSGSGSIPLCRAQPELCHGWMGNI